MTSEQILLLIIIGVFSGFISGLLGIGGAIIMIPGLIFLLGFSEHQAIGTSLAVMLPPIGILATYNFYKAGHVNLKFAIIIAICFIIGSYFGSKLAININSLVLKKIFAIVLFLIALKMLLTK